MLDFFYFIRYNKLNKNKGEQNKKRKGESTRNVILTQKFKESEVQSTKNLIAFVFDQRRKT